MISNYGVGWSLFCPPTGGILIVSLLEGVHCIHGERQEKGVQEAGIISACAGCHYILSRLTNCACAFFVHVKVLIFTSTHAAHSAIIDAMKVHSMGI